MKRFFWWQTRRRSAAEGTSPDDLAARFAAYRAAHDEAASDSFDAARHALLRANQDRPAQHVVTSTTFMQTLTTGRRMRLTAYTIMLALAVAACNMPVEQEASLGYLLSGTIEMTGAKESDKAFHELPWVNPAELGLSLVESQTADGEATSVMQFALPMPDVNEHEAYERLAILQDFGFTKEVTLTPLTATYEQPAYKAAARALHSAFEIHLDESVVESSVQGHLEALRLHGFRVKHVTDTEGNRSLQVEHPAGTLLKMEARKDLEEALIDLRPDASLEGSGPLYEVAPAEEGAQAEIEARQAAEQAARNGQHIP